MSSFPPVFLLFYGLLTPLVNSDYPFSLPASSAMLHKPEILFLDEPTTGLDPNYRNILWDQMLKMNKEGTTIFLTTHYMR